jgi:hypothetical protein
MQKTRNPSMKESFSLSEAKALLFELGRMRIRQEDIERATKISQSQISRLIAGDFKRVNGNALKLCKYAKKYASKSTRRVCSQLGRRNYCISLQPLGSYRLFWETTARVTGFNTQVRSRLLIAPHLMQSGAAEVQ